MKKSNPSTMGTTFGMFFLQNKAETLETGHWINRLKLVTGISVKVWTRKR